jgi:tripartite-type tricarboxylate transporter receptor subunit TctC
MKNILTRICITFAAIAAINANLSYAQKWPEKPIRMVIAFAPGGVHDTLTRTIQPRLQEALGQPLLIENRGGAGGNLAAEAVARSAPDGYTLLVASEAIATNEALYGKLNFDPQKDLTPVAITAGFPLALVVTAGLSANSVKELVALAKAKPGSLSFGSAGIGASGHLAGEMWKSLTETDAVHVPYKGGAPAMNDLVAGRLQYMFLSVSLSAPQVQQGKLRALAVVDSSRASLLPQVPTIAEAGFPSFDALLYSSVLAPAGTPAPVITRLNEELARTMRSPDLQKRFADIGAVPRPSTPSEFAATIARERERWGKLIREKNIRAE